MRNFYFLSLFFLFSTVSFFAQNQKEREKIIAHSDLVQLNKLAFKYKNDFYSKKIKADNLAAIYNWEKTIKTDSTYSELIGVTLENKPIYYTTYNNGAGITSRANRLYTGGGLGLNVNGEGMLGGVWDAGSGMPSHELFSGRLQVMDGTINSHYHSAHVAGTIIGSEVFQSGEAKGMAYKASVYSYDWNNDASEVANAAADGLLLSNHSYGYNPTFLDLYQWGKYDLDSQAFDEIMFNAPYYQFVCAAGNSRDDGLNTTKLGYDLLTGHSVSKNAIVVAAVNEVINYTGSGSVVMSNFSSWGPTDDGRIKPDISAKGVNTYSATDSSTSSYDSLSGTSMASPSVAGTLLLLQQYNNQLNNSFLKASTLKGLMIHSADEAGTSPGPDYRFGWGLINAEKGADIITKKELQSYILENTLNNSQTFSLQVNSLGTEPLVATLSWTDPAGNLPSTTIDDSTPNLVNDLDIRVSQTSTVYYPWKLNPANPSNAATTGDNSVDNVEKVQIDNPNGSYTITISHKGNLENLLQNYSLIISGITVKDFWITSNDNLKEICVGNPTTSFALDLHTKSNFSDTVTFSVLDLPLGVSASVAPSNMTSGGTFSVAFSGLTVLNPGEYEFVVRGQSVSDFYDFPVKIIIYSSIFEPLSLESPANFSVGIPTISPIVFQWENNNNSQDYFIEIATDDLFTTIVESGTVNTNQYSSSSLLNSTTYYWRVKSINECSESSFSNPYSFSTSCSLTITNLIQVASGSDSITVQWNDNNSTNWEFELVPEGGSPTGVGTMISTNPYTLTGLLSSTCYTFYIRSSCTLGFTEWISINACTQADYCGGDHFYDTGGPSGNYQDQENWTQTIYPPNTSNRIRAIFNSYSVESCCDYLRIYDGPNTSSPLLFNGGSVSPGNLVSTHPTGALTFRFTTDGSVTSSGWDATIICEEMPACPYPPSNITLTGATSSSLTVGWTENGSSTSWEVELVPIGGNPTGMGIETTTNPHTFLGLAQLTSYVVYVRSVCDAGFSEWTASSVFETTCDTVMAPVYESFEQNIIPSCWTQSGDENWNFSTFADYDASTAGDHTPGGGTNYAWIDGSSPYGIGHTSYLSTMPIDVSNLTSPSIQFWVYSKNTSELDYNTLKVDVLDGSSAITVYTLQGETNNGWEKISINLSTFSIVNNVIIVRFSIEENANTPYLNDILIDDVKIDEFPLCADDPSNLALMGATDSSLTVGWTQNGNSTSWEVELVPQGSNPTGSGIVISTNPYTFTDLASSTCYNLFVKSLCTIGSSDWVNLEVCTQADYCGGDHFYDTGGPSGNYQDQENWTQTIYPPNTSNRIRAIFNSYSVESCCDYLRIYDGPNTSSPLLFNGGSVSPGNLVSTHPTGALTFRFTTDGSVTSSGWDATIICENSLSIDNPNELDSLKYYPNPVVDELKIESKTVIKSYVVFDNTGRLILSNKIGLDNFVISFNHFAAGVYRVILEDIDFKTANFSVIKK